MIDTVSPQKSGLATFRKVRLLLSILLFVIIGKASSVAAVVDTADTYSASMKKNIKAVVIKPKEYDGIKKYPVVYLLHGFAGNYRDWITKVPAIKEYADRYKLMIVCPDGNFGSWYFDSPVNKEVKYETYVAKELVHFIDDHYKTLADKKSRAIIGLSMGGHGALYLSFRHQDVFGAAGSMSGGVDLRPFPNNWGISSLIGTYADQPERWNASSVINMTNLLTPGALAIIIQCGTEDFFYKVNCELHEKLLYNNIPHTFIASPGGHTWEYWGNAIQYQLNFVNGFFTAGNSSM